MKKTLALVLAILMVLALVACTPAGATNPSTPAQSGTTTEQSGGTTEQKNDQPAQQTSGGELAGTYDITVWCADNIVDLTKKQIEDFNASNTDGIVINATVEPVGEGDAATQIVVDVEAGGDIFCFAQDQFARLVQAGALSKLGVAAAEMVKANNDPDSVAAVSLDGDLYAYPLTADNGYFMYYDKSVVKEEHLGSLEDILADCEAANKYFAFETNTSAWYLASWFFATGCKSDWTTDSDGNFTAVNDTFNSPEGIIACKGMKKLLDSKANLSASDGAAFASNAAVVVTGTWAYSTVAEILGDNLGAAPLPSFTVDGKTYHLGSFNGFKLLGVKPQADPVKAAAVNKLAQYLTGEKAQLERFEAVAWGPSNLADLQLDAVKNHPAISAVMAQKEFATPQGQIHGSWWNIAKVIGDDVAAATDDAGLQKALDNYKEKIDALFGLTGYIFVGAWCNWDNADASMLMKEADGVLTLTLDVPESDYMGGRIVVAGEWGTDYGYNQVTTGKELLNPDMDPSLGNNGDNNIVFAAAGNYTVTCNLTTGEITIVKN